MTSHVDWIIVVNHRAGFQRSRTLYDRLTTHLEKYAQSWHLVQVQEDVNLDTSLEKALQVIASTKGVMVLGGDGTVHHVVNKLLLARNDVPVAVIPTGSGNDFARQCGLIGREVEELIDCFLHQEPREVDVLKVNDSFALQVISTGFDAHVSKTARSRFRKLGRFRYSIIVPLQLLKMRTVEYNVEIDGQRMNFTSPLVAIANGNTYGGGMLVSPSSIVEDGLFELIFVSELSRLELLAIFPKVFRGSHIAHRKVKQIRGRRLLLKASTIAEADGEKLSDSPLLLNITVARLKTWVA